MAALDGPAGRDVHDRLRRPRRLRRAALRRGGRATGIATDHTSSSSHPDAVDLVEKLVWHHDQPFGDSSAIPTYLLSEVTRAARDRRALSGDGGDELFAGYERFAAGLAARALRGAAGAGPARARTAALDLAAAGRAAAAKAAARAALRGRRRTRPARRLPMLDQLRRRGATATRCSTGGRDDWALEDYRAIWRRLRGRPPARPSARPEPAHLPARRPAREGRPDEHGPRASRCARRSSTRADRAMPRACRRARRRAACRSSACCKRGRRRPAARGDPRSAASAASASRWTAGSARTCAATSTSTLGARDARVREHLAGAAVDAMLAEHRAGARNHGHALWTLLTLEVFLRREGW